MDPAALLQGHSQPAAMVHQRQPNTVQLVHQPRAQTMIQQEHTMIYLTLYAWEQHLIKDISSEVGNQMVHHLHPHACEHL